MAVNFGSEAPATRRLSRVNSVRVGEQLGQMPIDSPIHCEAVLGAAHLDVDGV